uniref:RING-type E3 ubiquitin transferase n=1 Tax=Meloidogyne javanica TaxID=6303 RepID=A0A915NBE4_MELJA
MECEDDIINPDFNSYDNEETNYDEVRSPHKQLVNSGGIKMPVLVKKLGPSLTCPICLDLLRNTTVTRQCPTCRRKIVSKRNLRSDPNIDLLIDTIWPDRNIYERIHNILMESTYESPTKIRDLTVENDDNVDDFSSSENDFPSNDEKEENDFFSSGDDELNDFE